MPDTCENWLGLVNSCVYYAHQTHEIYQILPYSVDFKAREELWNPLSETVFSIWTSAHVNNLNDCKAQK